MILVPSKALKPELRQQPPASAAAIVELANRFDVSIEVMTRRLNECGVFEHGWAPILARRSGETLAIEYAVYPPWVKSHFSVPKRGVAFNGWFRGMEQADGVLRKETQNGILEARPVKVTRSLVVFELRTLS